MATTITAPVVGAPAAGQQNVQQYPVGSVGAPLPDVVGACTTSGGNITVEVLGENGADASVTFAATLLTYTTAGKFSYIPDQPGLYKIVVTDVTAGQSATTYVEVFET